MLYCYTKKCFTAIIIISLALAKSSFAATADSTKTANSGNGITSGTVVDEENRPLKGATITVKGSSNAVQTNSDGHFEINAGSGSTLEIKAVNHYTNNVVVKNQSEPLKIRLLDQFLQSYDKIDVLYGVRDKSDFLGSISTVYTNQLVTTPGPTYDYSLPGQLTGLYTHQTSGFAQSQNGGTALLVQFLGQGDPNVVNGHNVSINDNSEFALSVRNHAVTTVIDGIQQNVAGIDPGSIESISILKDALSTMLLGINSSNPILLITTKKPEIGQPRISFTTQTAVQQSLGLPNNPLPAYLWAYLYNEGLENDGSAAFYTANDIAKYRDHSDPYGHPDVNWFNLLLKPYSPMQSDRLNVSGGDDVARYTISLGYLNQGGIFKEAPDVTYHSNNNISRYTLNSNINVNVTKNLSVDLQMYGRVQQMVEPGGLAGYGTIISAIEHTPNNAYPVRNPDGSLGGASTADVFKTNLLGMAQYSGYTQTNLKNVLVNLDLNYNLSSVTPGLSLKARGNLAIESQTNIVRTEQRQAYTFIQLDSTIKYSPIGSSSSLSNTFSTILFERDSFTQLMLDYDRRFGKSRVGAQALFDSKSIIANYDLPAETTNKALRGSYSYDDKYMAEATVNTSTYNRYAPGRQRGWFWAGGLGWQMGKESFIKDNVSWIDSWKWRVDYGKTGNNSGAPYYIYKQTYTNSGAPTYFFGINHAGTVGYMESTPIADPYISWESAKKLDVGADISLFHNLIQVNADYYHEKYYGLLTVPGDNIAILGTSYPAENLGQNLYTGFELALTYKNHINNFNYFITVNGASQASKVLFNDELPQRYPWLTHTGLPTNTIFGYTSLGYWTTADIGSKYTGPNSYTPQPGDIKYQDLNGDGKIDANDAHAIGNLKPLLFYGTTLGFNYKGFNLSMVLQGVGNLQRMANGYYNLPMLGFGLFGSGTPSQAYTQALDRWTPQTAATATKPRFSPTGEWAFNGNNSQSSTFYLKPANYFRLKNAEIGYTLPLSWAQRLKLASIRVFINAENIFTIAGYQEFPGEDPEINGDGSYPIQRVINGGLSIKL